MKKNSPLELFPKILLTVIICAIFLFIYDLNKLYPLFADDWDYSFMYYGTKRIQNIFEVFPSQMKHYTMWGGRLVVHGILQELLYFGTAWCDFLNSTVFIIYILVIYKVVNKKNKINLAIPIWILMLTWFLQSNFPNTTLWLTGSVNYLWGTSIILLFIYPYYNYTTNYLNGENTFNKDGISKIIFFFFCGLIAGWTNENTAIAMIFMILLFLFCVWIDTKTAPKWSLSGLVGACVGASLMILAPGNYARYKKEVRDMGLTDTPTIEQYIQRLESFFDSFYHHILILVIIYLALLLLFKYTSNRNNKKAIIKLSLIFITGALIGSFALLAAPTFHSRAWFGVITFFFIAILLLYANLDFSSIYSRLLNWSSAIIVFIFFICSYKEGRAELVKFNNFVYQREIELLKQKSEGKTDIILHGGLFEIDQDLILPKTAEYLNDSNAWIYKAYIRYHNIESVKVEE